MIIITSNNDSFQRSTETTSPLSTCHANASDISNTYRYYTKYMYIDNDMDTIIVIFRCLIILHKQFVRCPPHTYTSIDFPPSARQQANESILCIEIQCIRIAVCNVIFCVVLLFTKKNSHTHK